jgi:hypothetical protein
MDIIVINSKNQSRISGVLGLYSLIFATTEGVTFMKNYSTALFYTANSYITINTWYKIKVTRTKLGVFTMYIKGGAFGNVYTLVSVTGGGTNPVTDTTYNASEYFVLDFDAGDRIALINILDGIKQ